MNIDKKLLNEWAYHFKFYLIGDGALEIKSDKEKRNEDVRKILARLQDYHGVGLESGEMTQTVDVAGKFSLFDIFGVSCDYKHMASSVLWDTLNIFLAPENSGSINFPYHFPLKDLLTLLRDNMSNGDYVRQKVADSLLEQHSLLIFDDYNKQLEKIKKENAEEGKESDDVAIGNSITFSKEELEISSPLLGDAIYFFAKLFFGYECEFENSYCNEFFKDTLEDTSKDTSEDSSKCSWENVLENFKLFSVIKESLDMHLRKEKLLNLTFTTSIESIIEEANEIVSKLSGVSFLPRIPASSLYLGFDYFLNQLTDLAQRGKNDAEKLSYEKQLDKIAKVINDCKQKLQKQTKSNDIKATLKVIDENLASSEDIFYDINMRNNIMRCHSYFDTGKMPDAVAKKLINDNTVRFVYKATQETESVTLEKIQKERAETFQNLAKAVFDDRCQKKKRPIGFGSDLEDIACKANTDLLCLRDLCKNKLNEAIISETNEKADTEYEKLEKEISNLDKKIDKYTSKLVPINQRDLDTKLIFDEDAIKDSSIAKQRKDDVEKDEKKIASIVNSLEEYGLSNEQKVKDHYNEKILPNVTKMMTEYNDNIAPKLQHLIQELDDRINDPNFSDGTSDDVYYSDKYSDLININEGVSNEKLFVKVSLTDENYSELFFEDPTNDVADSTSYDTSDYSHYYQLVDAAVNVKRQPIFSDYGDINSYPCFKPFKFQLDSIRTMLSRFEGNGIFGDQVGLGKTIQTLVTADVMARCHAIKNAVIVANEHIIGQWRKECKNKFRKKDDSYIFDLYPADNECWDEENQKLKISYSLDELLEKLEKDSEKDVVSGDERPNLRVYFLSTEKLKEEKSIQRLQNAKDALELEAELYKDKRLMTPLGDNFVALTADLSNEKCLARLYAIASRLVLEFKKAYVKDANLIERDLLLDYRYKVVIGNKEVSGEILWDDSNPWNIEEYISKDAGYINVDVFKNKDGNFCTIIGDYRKKLEEIRQKCISLRLALEKVSDDAKFYKQQRLIDLLIFDEVQELLVSFSKKEKINSQLANENKDITTLTLDQQEIIQKADNNRLIQEFIATIQKKYCILISATPIRDDLDDIFNLLYMVDKNKLGDTLEKAKNRFYDGYCDGCRSLSEMANAPDPEAAFSNLNGLINSRFTRKRLYDSDVLECMCRHTATEEEMQEAKRLGRDDFGGEKFLTLVQAVSYAHLLTSAEKSKDSEQIESLTKKMLEVKDYLFKDFFDPKEYENELPDDDYVLILKRINKKIKELQIIDINRGSTNLKSNIDANSADIDTCAKFISSYKMLRDCESLNDGESTEILGQLMTKEEAIKLHLGKCNQYCSIINKGLLNLFNDTVLNSKATAFLRYPYLSDFIDRRRPPKKGVSFVCKSVDEKLEFIRNAFTITEGESYEISDKYEFDKNSGLSNEYIIDSLQQNKILLFEKDHIVRRDMYRNLREPEKYDNSIVRHGDKRRVYVNLPTNQEELDNLGYTGEEYLDICYYDAVGKNSDFCKRTYDKIKIFELDSENNNLSTEEKLYVSRWEPNSEGVPSLDGSYANASLDWFKSIDDSNENWNSIYLMTQSQIAGTNMEAAKVLVIAQLDFFKDGSKPRYLDPLEFEQLIGRISRTGQTEECIVYTCLFNGTDDDSYGDETSSLTSEIYDEEFNRLYYDILSDPEGFDLFGKCTTEVDFVVPVVMACLRQLFGNDKPEKDNLVNKSVHTNSEFKKIHDFSLIKRDYIAVYDYPETKAEALEALKKIETFPQMLQFAKYYENIGSMRIFKNGDYTNPVSVDDVFKNMVRTYAKILSHNADMPNGNTLDSKNSEDTNN